jgi:hypothetical protein
VPIQYQRREGFIHRHVAGEHLLIATRRERTAPMFMLTETAAVLWDALEEWRSPESLTEYVVERFDVEPATAAADVATFLEQLQSLGSLDVREV